MTVWSFCFFRFYCKICDLSFNLRKLEGMLDKARQVISLKMAQFLHRLHVFLAGYTIFYGFEKFHAPSKKLKIYFFNSFSNYIFERG